MTARQLITLQLLLTLLKRLCGYQVTTAASTVLKLQWNSNGVPIDLSLKKSHCAMKMDALVCKWVEEAPLLRPLVLLVKQFLVNVKLCDPAQGGMPSIALAHMLRDQLRVRPTSDCYEAEESGLKVARGRQWQLMDIPLRCGQTHPPCVPRCLKSYE